MEEAVSPPTPSSPRTSTLGGSGRGAGPLGVGAEMVGDLLARPASATAAANVKVFGGGLGEPFSPERFPQVFPTSLKCYEKGRGGSSRGTGTSRPQWMARSLSVGGVSSPRDTSCPFLSGAPRGSPLPARRAGLWSAAARRRFGCTRSVLRRGAGGGTRGSGKSGRPSPRPSPVGQRGVRRGWAEGAGVVHEPRRGGSV